MNDLERTLAAYHLRDAIVQMAIRYGSSQQLAAYAQKNGDVEKHKVHQRAARRQFWAIQWLAGAAARLAGAHYDPSATVPEKRAS